MDRLYVLLKHWRARLFGGDHARPQDEPERSSDSGEPPKGVTPPAPLDEQLSRWWDYVTWPRRPRYTVVGITFHWTMAALVLFQLGFGWWMSRLPVGYDKVEAYGLHGQVGLTIFLLAFMRLGWRLVVPRPLSTEDIPGWQHVAARITHWGLYFMFAALPLTGWLMLTGDSWESVLTLYGLVPWPGFPGIGDMAVLQRAQWQVRAETAHTLLVFGLAGLLVLHIGAALKHQFWNKDEVLHRMAPIVKPLSGRRSTEESPQPDMHPEHQSPAR